MASRACIAEMIQRLLVNNYPKPPADDVLDMVVESWAEDFAGLTDDDLRAACRSYRQSIDPADRWWPQPGRLIALSPIGRAIAHLGSDTDADRAWADFNRRMHHLAGRGGPFRGERDLDREPYRNDAMWAGLEGMGGARAWDRMDAADRATPARWRAAYVSARVASRGDRDAVRTVSLAIGGPAPHRQIGETK